MERQQILEQLRAHRVELEAQGVRSLRLFGSVARGQESAGSDVDLLVAFSGRPKFRQFMRLRFFLEDLLGRKVDLVTETGLREAVRAEVEREAIVVT